MKKILYLLVFIKLFALGLAVTGCASGNALLQKVKHCTAQFGACMLTPQTTPLQLQNGRKPDLKRLILPDDIHIAGLPRKSQTTRQGKFPRQIFSQSHQHQGYNAKIERLGKTLANKKQSSRASENTGNSRQKPKLND